MFCTRLSRLLVVVLAAVMAGTGIFAVGAEAAAPQSADLALAWDGIIWPARSVPGGTDVFNVFSVADRGPLNISNATVDVFVPPQYPIVDMEVNLTPLAFKDEDGVVVIQTGPLTKTLSAMVSYWVVIEYFVPSSVPKGTLIHGGIVAISPLYDPNPTNNVLISTYPVGYLDDGL